MAFKTREQARRYQNEIWYPKNRKLHMARVAASQAKRVAAVRAELNRLKQQPCADCGNTFPPECMDFDHLPGSNKLAGVSRLVTNRSCKISLIREEIKKCEIVCANCHRIRTAERRKKAKLSARGLPAIGD